MTSICKQTGKDGGVNRQLTARLLTVWIVILMSLFIATPGVVAQTNVDFFCTLGGSTSACTGHVVQSGSNFSTSGITVYNDSGPFMATVPFTWAFNTATDVVSIKGTGVYSGMDLIGNILSFSATGIGPNKGFSLVADWGTLPTSVQTQLGTPTGQDVGFVIYLTGTGSAESVDVLIAPASLAPEPASMLLMGTGLLAIGSLLRRRRTTSA